MKKSILVVMSTILLLCTSCGKAQSSASDASIDNEPKISEVRDICNLTTMECYYHNVAKFDKEDAEGFWLWKKDEKFWISYSGIVKIGIDGSKVTMDISDDDTVTINIPDAYVQSTKVDPDSLNDNSVYKDKDSVDIPAKDQTAAFAEAEANMKKQAEQDATLLTSAQQRAQKLIENYIDNIGDVVGKEYTIVWTYSDGTSESSESSVSTSSVQ